MKYKKVSSYGVSSPIKLPWYVKLFGKKDEDGRISYHYDYYLPYTKEWQWQEEHPEEHLAKLRIDGIII